MKTDTAKAGMLKNTFLVKGLKMNNYQYYMKMKNICENRGREKPELKDFFAEAAKGFEKKSQELRIEDIVPVTKEQKKFLSFYGVKVC